MSRLNLLLGRSLSAATNVVLRQRLPYLDPRYPRGRVMPLDLLRFAAVDGGGPIRRVLDVGANNGGTSLELAKWLPVAEFHAFEPIAATFDVLRRNVAGHPRIAPFQTACGDEPGRVTVTLRGHDTINTLRDASPDEPAKSAAGRTESVTVTTVDAHCAGCGWDAVDLLKTDTEGFDLAVLRGARGLLGREAVRYIYCEVGFHGQEEQTSFCDVARLVGGYGFNLAGFFESWRTGPAKRSMPFANAPFARTSTLTLSTDTKGAE